MSNISDSDLADSLSHERLTSYLTAAGGNMDRALRLYEWNVEASGAFFELMCHVEIAMRNAWHLHLAGWNAASGYEGQWYDNNHGFLDQHAVDDIAEAILRIRRKGKAVIPPQVVAELNFGFWRFLLTPRYKTDLWVFAGTSAFPNVEPGYVQQFFNRVARLHDLRNRIAHHEPIHWRKLDKDLKDCMSILRAVSIDLESWADSRSRVALVLTMRPWV
ncbi:MAG: Abi family protein [Acidimicrobiales bacterium]